MTLTTGGGSGTAAAGASVVVPGKDGGEVVVVVVVVVVGAKVDGGGDGGDGPGGEDGAGGGVVQDGMVTHSTPVHAAAAASRNDTEPTRTHTESPAPVELTSPVRVTHQVQFPLAGRTPADTASGATGAPSVPLLGPASIAYSLMYTAPNGRLGIAHTNCARGGLTVTLSTAIDTKGGADGNAPDTVKLDDTRFSVLNVDLVGRKARGGWG